MDEVVEHLCDHLDASVFSGDSLHDAESLKEFRSYLERWGREADNIQQLLDEAEEGKQ